MPNDVDWPDVVWNEINEAVLQEVAKVRVAEKVFPTELSYDNPTEVRNDVISFSDLTIQEGSTKPFVEFSRGFTLTGAQVSNEAEKKTAKTLARMAAVDIALGGDTVTFQGTDGTLPEGVVALQRASAGKGLLGVATRTIKVPPLAPRRPGLEYGENIFTAVAAGIAQLTEDGQGPEFALFLNTREYAESFAPIGGGLDTTADRIRPMVLGGFYGTPALPPGTGLMAALAGQSTIVHIGRDATAEFVQQKDSTYEFRVSQRLTVVVTDPRALLKLAFQPQVPPA